MSLTRRAIDRPRVVIMSSLLLLVLAIIAAMRVPVQRVPAIRLAVVLIAVPYPGAEPQEVEEQITRKIEDALQRLTNVDEISSRSMRGSSVTQVLFLDGVDPEQARTEVEQLINQVRNQLPAGREVQPLVTDIDFQSEPIVLVSVAGPRGFDERALKEIAEEIQDDLETIPGVASTQLFGGRQREIQVNGHPDLLAPLGLSLMDLRAALVRGHAMLPGGTLDNADTQLQVRNETRYRTLDDIRETIVAQRQDRLIRIGDIADVLDTDERTQNVGRFNGEPTATIIVTKEADINTLGTARAIHDRLQVLQREYPHLKLTATQDISEEISIMFSVLGSNALQGALLVLVILAWTMGLRSSLLVIMTIPVSAAVTLVFLYLLDIPISNMVLFSAILVSGMVVDGAIIVTENIHRHLELGKTPYQAALDGTEEVALPVIAGDVTTCCAYLPMMLVPGIMGDFLGVMPQVVSVALLSSVLVDHFLVPVLAARCSKQRAVAERHSELEDLPAELQIRPHLGLLGRLHVRLLRWALDHYLLFGLCFAGAIFGAGVLLTQIGFEFFPPSDRGQFEISYELPLGSSIEQTVAAAAVFEEPLHELQAQGLVRSYVTAIGSSGGLSARLDVDPATGPEFGRIMVQLTPPTERKIHEDVLIAQLRRSFRPWPGLKYRIDEIEEGPPGGAEVAIRMTGDDLEQLGVLATMLAARLRQIPGTEDVETDFRPDSPEIQIEPDAALLGLYSLTELDLAQTVQTAVLGDTTIELPLGDEDVTLRLQIAEDECRTPTDLEQLTVISPTGRRALLGDVATLRRSTGLYAVSRFERNRAVVVRCNVSDDILPDDVFAVLRRDVLPELAFRGVAGDPKAYIGSPTSPSEGVQARFTGENEDRDENFAYLLWSMLIGVVLIFGVLVLEFNSFRQTLVVLLTVPLSFIGVVVGMWACGFPFSLASFIGLVSLSGVVVNDATVLVDTANHARRRGLAPRDAILEAGINRARPVMLTTVNTVAGLLPLFLNFSGGAEFWQPLAGAIIFGLSFSTLLTLLVVPVGYRVMYLGTKSPTAK